MLGVLLSSLAVMVPAQPAHATFHEVLISELYPGSAAGPQSSFLELQMYSSGQNFVGSHTVTLYHSDGSSIGTFAFPADLPGDGSNQQTMLIGDSGVQEAFGVAPDLLDAGFEIPAAGGAACWDGLDCVSWGNFTGQTAPSSGIPADAGGIPDGKAIERRISGGTCGNLLDPADDSDDSDSEFVDGTPSPLSYATVPAPVTCTLPPPTPSTLLDEKPPSFTNSTEAKFSFHASSEAAGFQCRLDQGSYKDCTSGSKIAYPGPLAEGSHNFRVRASNANGVGSSASYTWTVDLTAPTAKITNHPADPSPGNSASFRYGSSDGGSKFECRLSPIESSFAPCDTQPKVYSNLANGDYEFEVRTIDNAGNVQPVPTVFPWTVDNSLLDETPPETTILSRPMDPSTSPVATFTYSSNEPGSTFQCKLDSGGFSGCPAGGITYSGLADGPHSFQVKAVDASHNTDPTPAGYSFTVVLAGAAPASTGTGSAPGKRTASGAPNTTIAKQGTQIRDRTPTFRFGSSKPGASFQCKLDYGAFRSCRSPFTTKKLSFGSHALQVRAAVKGATDPTPAKFSFKIVKG
ncbi:MAG: large repetitive protein [Solirubrobacterales bacterium]|jgi:hypothetical protein|nr:large repetitive protein [Solirubrobacterales bacterium]